MFEDISKCEYDEFAGKNVLLRIIEGIGYRFNRCSIGIEQHKHFKPTSGHLTIQELVTHIGNLMKTALDILSEKGTEKKEEYNEGEVKEFIENLHLAMREKKANEFNEMCKNGKDVFYAINGPLLDAISHIGQINTYKRLLNIKSPKASYYKGEAT